MTKPREKTREELTAEIEDGKKKIRQFENREKVLRRKLSIDAVLNALELSDYRERHPASLSGGQKQRVTIGVAIVKDSLVIYFDEPTSGLDYDSMVRVSKLIEQLSDSGVIVFVVSHDFEFIVRTCTEVVQLDDDGTIQNQQLSPTVLKSLSEKYFT